MSWSPSHIVKVTDELFRIIGNLWFTTLLPPYALPLATLVVLGALVVRRSRSISLMSMRFLAFAILLGVAIGPVVLPAGGILGYRNTIVPSAILAILVMGTVLDLLRHLEIRLSSKWKMAAAALPIIVATTSTVILVSLNNHMELTGVRRVLSGVDGKAVSAVIQLVPERGDQLLGNPFRYEFALLNVNENPQSSLVRTVLGENGGSIRPFVAFPPELVSELGKFRANIWTVLSVPPKRELLSLFEEYTWPQSIPIVDYADVGYLHTKRARVSVRTYASKISEDHMIGAWCSGRELIEVKRSETGSLEAVWANGSKSEVFVGRDNVFFRSRRAVAIPFDGDNRLLFGNMDIWVKGANCS